MYLNNKKIKQSIKNQPIENQPKPKQIELIGYFFIQKFRLQKLKLSYVPFQIEYLFIITTHWIKIYRTRNFVNTEIYS